MVRFDENQLKRTDLLKEKDIHNISSYNIPIFEDMRHSEDAISINLFIQECQQLENSPILLYSAQGEEIKYYEKNSYKKIIHKKAYFDVLDLI